MNLPFFHECAAAGKPSERHSLRAVCVCTWPWSRVLSGTMVLAVTSGFLAETSSQRSGPEQQQVQRCHELSAPRTPVLLLTCSLAILWTVACNNNCLQLLRTHYLECRHFSYTFCDDLLRLSARWIRSLECKRLANVNFHCQTEEINRKNGNARAVWRKLKLQF